MTMRGNRQQEADQPIAQPADDLLAPRLAEQVLGLADGFEGALAFDDDERHDEVRDERPGDADERDHDPAEEAGARFEQP